MDANDDLNLPTADEQNRKALDHLFSLTYEALRRLAAEVGRGDPSQTLNATALVNEAWMKLARSPNFVSTSELHFKRIAARAMRQVLVEAARRRKSGKRGRDVVIVTWDEREQGVATETEVLALHDALERLSILSPRQADLVESRFFGGMDTAELAKLLEVSEATVLRDWRAAKAWLARELRSPHQNPTPMTTERWQQIQKLFHEALERPASERTVYVESSCSSDPALLSEVVAMLEEDSRASSLLDRGLKTVAASIIGQAEEHAPRQIGPYQIERILGEGGMGIVCLAKRSDLGTTVAIKLLRDAWMSPARRERFAAEQKTLAQLQHTNIARLYDAGSTLEGTPWFAMEYVDGVPLTEYCSTHGASLNERLRLFRSVCEAVDYAHRHAIIHRDLKPNNILVTANGEVKLLDFSIAKQLDAEDEVALKTRTGLRMMTPAYAAPEQIRGASVSIQTDVYSLGVVLYELLTDRLPFIADHGALGALERMILESEPVKPSAVARSGTAGKSAWADLDVLCMTAMRKEPERRYRSVEALIRDLDHYLKGQPLEARPDRFSYRAVKFLRRNRVSVSVSAAVFAAVVGMVTFFTVNITRARNAALAESARTQTIQRFMLNLFDAGDDTAGPAADLKVVDLLGRGVQEAKGLDHEPLVQAELYRTLGGIYEKIGKFEQADSLLHLALEQRRGMLGNDHADVARSNVDLGLLRVDQAKLDEAEKLVRDGLESARRALPPQDPIIAEATLALGKVLDAKGAYDKAIPVLEEALKLAELHGPNTREVAESLVALSSAHFYLGHHDICDALNQRALDLHKRLNGERHPLVAADLINLGASQFERGEYVKAEPYFRQALAINEAFYGPDHFETAASLTMLGRTLSFQKRYDEATAALERALSIQERVNGPTHPRVASNLNELGNIASVQQRYADAEKRFRRVLEIYKTVYPSSHYLIGVATANLATVYMNSQQLPRAEQLFREALQIYAQSLPADHVNVGITRIKLGRTLLREKRYSDAEKETHGGHDIVAKQSNPSVSFLQAARHDLGEEYEALHQPDKAAEFRTAAAK